MLTGRRIFDRRCRPIQRELSSRFRLSAKLLIYVVFISLASTLASQVAQSNEIVKFRLRDGYLMIVPVLVNGAGPFNFLLDTGTTRSVIDPELARQLQAPAVGEAAITTVLHLRQDKLVQLRELRLGDSSVSGLGAIVDKLTRQKILAPGIRGVLGEEFLSKFDILIDYKQHWLRFGDAPPTGERCRVETIGEYRGLPTTNRLLITAELVEIGGKKLQLQLDTGAKIPEIFPTGDGSLSSLPWGGSIATSSGANGTTIYASATLKIGTTLIRDTDIVQSRNAVAFDAAGLLPASLFHRLYISHSGGYVIFNPVQ